MTAAVALLRSVATKLARARAPQLHPRPLGRGLHGGGGAPSGAAGSLTPPTSKEKMIQQGMGGMAAVSKIARAQPTHPNPGASSFTPPPPSVNKDLIIEDLRRRLSIAWAAAGIGAGTITGTVVYVYFWVKPDVEARSSGRGKRTSEEELAEVIKDIRATIEEQRAKQAAFREDSQAALAKLNAAVKSLGSIPKEENVCLRGFDSGTC